MSCREHKSTDNYFVGTDIPFSELMKKEVIKVNGQWITPITGKGEKEDENI